MGDVTFLLSRTVLLVCMMRAHGKMSSWECTPEKDINLSRYNGYGRFEEIISDSAVNMSSSASIPCSITGRSDFLRVEWIFLGEPPSVLMFKSEKGLLSDLHESTVTCTASDIPHINRPGPHPGEKSFVSGTGKVTYLCKGSENLKIVFKDVNLLSRDMHKLVGVVGTEADGCVRKSKMPEGELSGEVGNACKGGRYMYDEQGQFVCAQCCSDYYWSTTYKQCKRCTGITTDLGPNVWTSCKDSRDSEQTSTAVTLPTSATTSKALSPPSSAPEKITIVDQGSTYVSIKWQYPSSDPVDEYIVSIQQQRWFHNTSTNLMELRIQDLTPYTNYIIRICAKNKAGLGPWTAPFDFRTKGTAPTHPPSNVTFTCSEHRFNVSWNPIVGTQSGGEEPILSIKIRYRLTTNSSEKWNSLVSKDSSIDFAIEKDGEYEILVCSHNEIGDGPTDQYKDYCGDKKESVTGIAAFLYSLLVIFLQCVVTVIGHFICNRRS